MRRGPRPQPAGFGGDLLHLYTLSAFGVSQPLFDRLSGHVTFLNDHGLTGGHLVFLSAVLVLAVPTVLAIVETLMHVLQPQWRRKTHLALVGLLLVVIVCPAARHLAEHEPLIRWGFDSYLVLAISIASGVLMTMVYRRTDWFPRWISWASPAIVLFPLAFLLVSPANTVLFPQSIARQRVRAKHPVPVVMVVFDAFCGMSLLNEEHRIDAVRYPAFARLAETATWYRNATTVRPRTSSAVPAILTGSMPQGTNQPLTESVYPQNLFRLLEDTTQYDFVIYETVGRLASRELNRQPADFPEPPLARVAFVLPTLSAVYLHAILPASLPFPTPQVPPQWFGLSGNTNIKAIQGKGAFHNPWIGQRDRQCQRFLSSLDRSSKPALSFIHVCLPHYPWCFLPSGRQYQEDRAMMDAPPGGFGPYGEDWTDDPVIVNHSWRQYLLQVGYVDRFVGQLQDRLATLGLFDDCLLIVTADHGVAFLPGHSRREPDGANLSEILSIPLLIKYPHQHSGTIDDRNVESIDILPTIADVLDLQLPFEVDGSSIRNPVSPTRARKTLVQDNGELIVIDPRFPSKYDSVDRMIATFGTGAGDDRFWRAEPLPELIGRPIDEFAIDGNSSPPIELELQPAIIEPTTDWANDVVPCDMIGRVSSFGNYAAPLTLAVAVNGVIAGVTRTSTDPRLSDRFAVIVPESAFSGMADDRQFFAVLPGADGPWLEPCLIVEP